jgi:hypothetical protein
LLLFVYILTWRAERATHHTRDQRPRRLRRACVSWNEAATHGDCLRPHVSTRELACSGVRRSASSSAAAAAVRGDALLREQQLGGGCGGASHAELGTPDSARRARCSKQNTRVRAAASASSTDSSSAEACSSSTARARCSQGNALQASQEAALRETRGVRFVRQMHIDMQWVRTAQAESSSVHAIVVIPPKSPGGAGSGGGRAPRERTAHARPPVNRQPAAARLQRRRSAYCGTNLPA